MRAKLSAQMETGVNFVVMTSAPAATRRPAMVSRRGRPAATRLPKAMIRMMIVTGHDSISERNMAERLAVLKSAHRALSPVSVTDARGGQSASWAAAASAACTILLESAADPAVMTAVRPSRRERDAGLRRNDGGNAGIAAQDVGGLGHDGLGLRVRRDRTAMVDDDDLQAGGTEAGEVLFDDGPCCN